MKLQLTDLRGSVPTLAELKRVLPRGGTDVDATLPVVQPIVEAVKARGVEAVAEYSEKFDGAFPGAVRVPAQALSEALKGVDPQVRHALEESIRRARIVHEAQRRTDDVVSVVLGGTVAQRWVPIDRVGLYVPGGKAVYPSTVIMNVVPAQAAGVNSLVVASPPQADFGGRPHPTILAACALLGVDEVWAVGGAQAVALLAYGGTDTDGTVLDPVDMITGPGNIYVTAAKRLCRSVVGIDAEAGPTEIAIIADASADPVHLAADLISQAEHDVLAASVLITPSAALLTAVEAELAVQVPRAKHAERIAQALAGQQSGAILVDSLAAAVTVANAYGAEHLEIQCQDAPAVAQQITSAGAVFVGSFAPVSLGDYAAGSNHVLPTAGTARHSSGLSVQTFLKGIHVVNYDEAALKEISGDVIALANEEDLPAHGEAVRLRFESGAPQ